MIKKKEPRVRNDNSKNEFPCEKYVILIQQNTIRIVA